MSLFTIKGLTPFFVAVIAWYPVHGAETADWPGFRGPGGMATADDANTATNWNVADGKGILWTADVPLPGAGSPIVWGERVFVSGAKEGSAAVFCFDAKSGDLLWRGDVPIEGSPESMDESTTFAAPTPVTDGKRVFAVFATGVIAAFNMDGTPAWNVNAGMPTLPYGYASSPVLYKDLLLVQRDQDGEDAALIALDAQSGNEAWRAKRTMGPSWCSPIVVETHKGPQAVVVSSHGVSAYDPKDGREIWTVKKETSDIANSPVFAGGTVIATLGNDNGTMAIRTYGTGDVTTTHIAWENDEIGSDVASPVACGGMVFVPSHSMFCLNADDGKQMGERELKGSFYASPIVADGKIYVINRDGETTILKADKTLEVLGKAAFGEGVDASPAVAKGCLFVRTRKRLFCIRPAGGGPPASPADKPTSPEAKP